MRALRPLLLGLAAFAAGCVAQGMGPDADGSGEAGASEEPSGSDEGGAGVDETGPSPGTPNGDPTGGSDSDAEGGGETSPPNEPDADDTADDGTTGGDFREPLDAGSGEPTRECTGPILFVTVADAHVFSLDPQTEELSLLGAMACGGSYPYSVAVDRDGMIWAYWWDEGIYVVDPDDLSCSPTAYFDDPALPRLLSMTFVRDPASDDETLHAMALEGEPDGGARSYVRLEGPELEPHELDGAVAADRQWVAQFGPPGGGWLGLAGNANEGVPNNLLLTLDPDTGAELDAQPLGVRGSGWPNGFVVLGDDAWLLGNFQATIGVFRYDMAADELHEVHPNLAEAAGLDATSLVAGAGVLPCPRGGTTRG